MARLAHPPSVSFPIQTYRNAINKLCEAYKQRFHALNTYKPINNYTKHVECYDTWCLKAVKHLQQAYNKPHTAPLYNKKSEYLAQVLELC